MAKRSLFWGQASGKLGETVLYRAGGEQRTRTYVAQIKNPKTLKQVENRLSMLNFSAIYRALKPVLSASFPNRPTNQSGFNAFVKANKSVNSPVVDKVDAQKGLCVPFDMLMSEGYLSDFGTSEIATGQYGAVFGLNLANHPNAATAFSNLGADSKMTGAAAIKGFLSDLGIPDDAKITYIVAEYKDTAYKVTTASVAFKDFGNLNNVGGVPVGILKSTESNNIVFGLAPDKDETENYICGVIISWVDANGKLQITTSRMITSEEGAEYAEQFVKGGDYYNSVLDAYGYNEGSVLG